MTGPEHYREAEQLLADAERYSRAGAGVGEMVEVAHVHATLALAAATALPHGGPSSASRAEWIREVHGL